MFLGRGESYLSLKLLERWELLKITLETIYNAISTERRTSTFLRGDPRRAMSTTRFGGSEFQHLGRASHLSFEGVDNPALEQNL